MVSGAGNIRGTQTGRVPVVVFGNSIAKLSAVYPISSTTSATAGATAAGATQFTVASATTLVAGDSIEFIHYDGSLGQATCAAGTTGTTVTLTAPLVKAVPTGEPLCKVGAAIYGRRFGPNALHRVLNAALGNALDIRNVYGYGGALSTQMTADFATAVLAYSPKACLFQSFENDVLAVGGTAVNGETKTLQQIKDQTAWYIAQCVTAGIVPIFSTPLPSFGFNTSALATAYDQMLAYVMSLPTLYPGTIVLPLHQAYIDTTASTTTRAPQGSAGVNADATVHPTALGAQLIVSRVGKRALLDAWPGLSTYRPAWPGNATAAGNFASNATCAGTGGTLISPATGACPAATQTTATQGSVVTCSVISSLTTDPLNGGQPAWQVDVSHSGGTDAFANLVGQRLLPITCAAGTKVQGFVEVELPSSVGPANVAGYGMQIDFGNGQTARSIDWTSSDVGLGAEVPGRIVLETPPMAAPAAGAGTARIYFNVYPKPGAGPASWRQVVYHMSIEQVL